MNTLKTGATKSYQSRIDNLYKLKAALSKYEAEMHAALKKDLGKPEFEAYLSETGFSLHEAAASIDITISPRYVYAHRAIIYNLQAPQRL